MFTPREWMSKTFQWINCDTIGGWKPKHWYKQQPIFGGIFFGNIWKIQAYCNKPMSILYNSAVSIWTWEQCFCEHIRLKQLNPVGRSIYQPFPLWSQQCHHHHHHQLFCGSQGSLHSKPKGAGSFYSFRTSFESFLKLHISVVGERENSTLGLYKAKASIKILI